MKIAAIRFLTITLPILTIVGCASKAPAPLEEEAQKVVEAKPVMKAAPAAQPLISPPIVEEAKPTPPTDNTIVYFESDSSDIKKREMDAISTHAAFLKTNPTFKVTVEGHADERGTDEYNMALGLKRSIALKKQLLSEGVSTNQIATVSFGETKPAKKGNNESAWHINRRAVIVYNKEQQNVDSDARKNKEMLISGQ